MRPLRLFLYLLSTLLFISSIVFLSLSSDSDQYNEPDDRQESRRGFSGFFSFHSPGSLFGQAATISLTEDNSTFFAARPAAFGPILPVKGLSGQIWVGGGFGVDNLKRRGIATGLEGELGCNDIPGWNDHYWRLRDERPASRRDAGRSARASASAVTNEDTKSSQSKRDTISHGMDLQDTGSDEPPALNDGSDDYLQHPLHSTTIIKRNAGNNHQSKGGPTEHADIQSLQESAEIAGKIVILSRGGCGFSEKVKWAQRRGASAVIIGDNVLGGSLIRMYARGDTSNITIPSLFTSHMSAQLLSSLIPHEKDSSSSGTLWKWPSTSALTPFRTKENHDSSQRPTDITSSKGPTDPPTRSNGDDDAAGGPSSGWIKSSLAAVGLVDDDLRAVGGADSRRPPSSGQLTWSKSQESNGQGVDVAASDGIGLERASKGFIIGVQDWRDPDVVSVGESQYDSQSSSSSSTAAKITARPALTSNAFRGGSITPGSGEYEQPHHKAKSILTMPKAATVNPTKSSEGTKAAGKGQSWLNILAWNEAARHGPEATNNEGTTATSQSVKAAKLEPKVTASKDKFNALPVGEVVSREGLWVTLTPTDMDSSPFLNTLFVLVVSPLMTLAIVYSMLLLRSRIRRRRWRAPKSVVERLPVHTYHRLSRTNSSSMLDNGISSPSTATTPLLPSTRPADINARPRSNTVCGPTASLASSSRYGSLQASPSEHEKVNAGLTAWRRKYRGKQVECVVCLEEYVDGVSKVMSLPCGHEFHVDCMYV